MNISIGMPLEKISKKVVLNLIKTRKVDIMSFKKKLE